MKILFVAGARMIGIQGRVIHADIHLLYILSTTNSTRQLELLQKRLSFFFLFYNFSSLELEMCGLFWFFMLVVRLLVCSFFFLVLFILLGKTEQLNAPLNSNEVWNIINKWDLFYAIPIHPSRSNHSNVDNTPEKAHKKLVSYSILIAFFFHSFLSVAQKNTLTFNLHQIFLPLIFYVYQI